MSVLKFTAIEGKGSDLDRAGVMIEAIKRACYENGGGLPLAFVLGCLKLAEFEIMEDQRK